MDGKTLKSAGSAAGGLTEDAANNHEASGASSPVTAAAILEGIKAHKEWAKAVAFDHDGRVIAATAKPQDGEVNAWLKLFDKREDTIASGIVFQNEQFDVHRYHPPLIYGRRGDPTTDDSEGISVCRVERKSNKQPIFCLITYTYPTLSARAAPQLKEFCETQLANLV
ncbi:hypothetical protein Poli38472_014659 [Pythium oligandrum]|uniref:Profilin n=1 Tax=Pythium oligandrum TaxID=41045 RepID=A0A8K1CI11_PYTOL|nr:hypothetical protein Poli38472_014659 [Pythium oligandrum]|eukprot:TMW63954.1 hypothetical protein Poli38472_014659 [Pythium oligandrum]